MAAGDEGQRAARRWWGRSARRTFYEIDKQNREFWAYVRGELLPIFDRMNEAGRLEVVRLLQERLLLGKRQSMARRNAPPRFVGPKTSWSDMTVDPDGPRVYNDLSEDRN